MGFSYSPKVVTDGLVLYLDAANPLSYASGSTKWRDLSKKKNHFDLVNSYGFESGSIYFDYDNQGYAQKQISRETTPELVPVFESFTVEACYKMHTTGSRLKYIGTGNYGQGGWNLGVGYSDFNFVDFSAYALELQDLYGTNQQYKGGAAQSGHDNSIDNFQFYQIVFNMDTNYTDLYVNGALLSSAYDGSRGTGAYNVTSYKIGRSPQGGWGNGKGHFALLKQYNRALTAQEVQRNYQALKSRFGL